MPFTLLDSIHRPSTGAVAPASWGDAVNDDIALLQGALTVQNLNGGSVSAPLLGQAASVVFASYTTGGVSVTFTTAFPTACLWIICGNGDAAANGGAVLTPIYSTITRTAVTVKAFTAVGTELAAGQAVRCNYLALGN